MQVVSLKNEVKNEDEKEENNDEKKEEKVEEKLQNQYLIYVVHENLKPLKNHLDGLADLPMTQQKDDLYIIFEQLWQNINMIFNQKLRYGEMKIFTEYILNNLYFREES